MLNGVLITNAVLCVPPEKRPTPEEFRTCRGYLEDTLRKPTITDILCIEREAYLQACRALEAGKVADFRCGGRESVGRFVVHASDHTSGYNQATGRIRQEDVNELLLRIVQDRLSKGARKERH